MANYNIPPTSRYYGIEIASIATPDGEQVPYLRRRFLPPSASFAPLSEHVVSDGERMDLIAARELGDAEAYWRICDANDAMRPDDLTVPIGRRLSITLPQGIPGTPGA
jgi:hypothetical protein